MPSDAPDLTPARLAEMAAMADTDLVWELQGFGLASFRALAARVIELEAQNARLTGALQAIASPPADVAGLVAMAEAMSDPDNAAAVSYTAWAPLMRRLAAALATIDTRTHVAVPREPDEATVERVARALADEADFDPDTDWNLPSFVRKARAAIAAMTEGEP